MMELFEQAQMAHRAGNTVEAERLYRAALEVEPGNGLAHRLLAILCLQREAAEDAETHFLRARELGLADPLMLFSLGHAQLLLGKPRDALNSYDKAIALKPDFLEAQANRGILLQDMNRPQEALAAFERVLALNPNRANSHNLVGTALSDLGRLDQAIDAFRTALALDPKMARAWFNLATALSRLDHHYEAVSAYESGLALGPNPQGENARFFTGLYLCDWRDHDAQSQKYLSDIDSLRPFQLLFLPASPAQQLDCARKASPPARAALPQAPRRSGRVRLGYLSKDFKSHPVAYLLAETLEQHDRNAFEIFALSHGLDDQSSIRKRVTEACEHFVDLAGLDDDAIAARLHSLGIDIVIDLDGHTHGARPGILRRRPAPVQVNYLGYPGTMGAPYIDYLIADAVITPPEHQPFYSEKLVQLPVCYLPASIRPAGGALTRAAAGLSDNNFVFCAFTAPYKITPDVFAIWMRLLNRTTNSILWLRGGEQAQQENLRREACRHGIDPARLVFAPHADAKTHFARLALADLYLDTLIYGAHTTASDALWSGVPVVTMLGDTFARRVAASLLTQAGLTELIANTCDEYEAIAANLAQDAPRLAKLKAHLMESRKTMFDSRSFARHLEAAYRTMWQRYLTGKKPESFATESFLSLLQGRA